MIILYLMVSSFLAGYSIDRDEDWKWNLLQIFYSIIFPLVFLWVVLEFCFEQDWVQLFLVLIGVKKVENKENLIEIIDLLWNRKGKVWRYLAGKVKNKLKND